MHLCRGQGWERCAYTASWVTSGETQERYPEGPQNHPLDQEGSGYPPSLSLVPQPGGEPGELGKAGGDLSRDPDRHLGNESNWPGNSGGSFHFSAS